MSDRCSKCKRKLTNPESILRGMGETCARKAGILSASHARNSHRYRNPLQTSLFAGLVFAFNELLILPDTFGVGMGHNFEIMATTPPLITASQVSLNA